MIVQFWVIDMSFIISFRFLFQTFPEGFGDVYAHLAESLFQTCSRPCTIMKSAQFADEFFQAYSGGCLLLAVRAVCRRQKKCLKWYKVNCIRRQRR